MPVINKPKPENTVSPVPHKAFPHYDDDEGDEYETPPTSLMKNKLANLQPLGRILNPNTYKSPINPNAARQTTFMSALATASQSISKKLDKAVHSVTPKPESSMSQSPKRDASQFFLSFGQQGKPEDNTQDDNTMDVQQQTVSNNTSSKAFIS